MAPINLQISEAELRVKVVFQGPADTSYAGLSLEIDLDIPEDYPNVPPECYIKQ